MTHSMTWSPTNLRWLCYECGRVDEATPDGDFVRNEVLGNASVPHIRNRMGIARPARPDELPRREPHPEHTIGWLDSGIPGHPGYTYAQEEYGSFIEMLRHGMEKALGVPLAWDNAPRIDPALEEVLVEKNFMTPSDEAWLRARGFGHDDD